MLLAPGIYLLLLSFVLIVYPERFYWTLTRTLGTFVIGKFAAAGAATPDEGDFVYWVFMIGSVDVLTGLFLIWNFDLLYRVPGLGPMLRVMEAKGALFLENNSWVRRVAFLGVVLIVIVPFQGTGAVMGSIVGRLIGLGPWRTLGAIVVGGYTGVTLMLSASILVRLLGQVDPLAAVGVVVLLAAVGYFVWRQWFRVRRFSEDEEAPADAAEPTKTSVETEPEGGRSGPSESRQV